MNILLWLVQGVLAFLYFSGGAFKVFSIDDVAKQMTLLPRAAWPVLGILEITGAVLLIVPLATRWMPVLSPIAAAVLAVETLVLAALYARYSLEVAVTNPLVWAAAMGLAAAFVAFGRFALAAPGAA